MTSQERNEPRPLRVTIIYMVEERTRERIHELCEQLRVCGIDMFIFSEDMPLVESHEAEMQKQIENGDAVIICYSKNFDNEGRGYRHQEVRIAKEEQRKRPLGNVYLIPVCLEECDVPDYLSKARVANYFQKEHFDGIMRWGLAKRRDQLVKNGEKIQEFKYHLLQQETEGNYFFTDRSGPESVEFPSLVTSTPGGNSSQESRFGAPFPEHWNVSRRHSPYFTDRNEQIEQIFQAFAARDAAYVPEPQALVGLGGLGKTQTAAEYAYRYREHYKAVLWARADNTENLVAGYHALIDLLGLPKQENPIKTMQSWFTSQGDWLLILDNADDLQIVDPFLPRSQRGHVLLTTRIRAASDIAQPVLLEPLSPTDGALCILRRAGSIPRTGQLSDASPSSRAESAIHLSELMEGLPLALEQAGAYIEDTGSSESRYLKIYEELRTEVLQRQFGALPNYPLPVATAWEFSKRVVQEKDPAAFALLQLCAFLAPDAIPEEIFTKGAQALGPVLGPKVTNAFGVDVTTIALRRYSLLNHEVKGDVEIPQFSMHRMMQEILQDEMDEATRQLWAERAVRAVSLALSSVDKHIIQAHVLHCLPLIEQWNMIFPEAERLRQYAEETRNASDE